MKINFLIPFISKSGGIIAVLEYFQHLKNKGHDPVLYYPLIPHWSIVSEKASVLLKIAIVAKRFLLKRRINWYFEPIPVTPVFSFSNRFIRDADISVATAWPTAYDNYRLNPSKGIKFYFVQGHETWINDTKTVENSYRLPLKIITISPWLTKIMEEKYSRKVEIEIHNGIRTDKFRPSLIRKEETITISTQYHELECKGSKEALLALDRIKKEFPQTRIIIFGLFAAPERTFDFEYYRNPSMAQIISIYQQSHIYLFTSRAEGWGMTPLEAMACKCAVAATSVGSISVIGNDKNIMRIEINNVESVVEGLRELICNRTKREYIAENGYQTSLNMSWEKQSDRLEKVFLEAVREPNAAKDIFNNYK